MDGFFADFTWFEFNLWFLSAVLPECRSCPEIFPAFSPRWYARAFRSCDDTSLGDISHSTVIQFSRCICDLQVQFSEKRCSLPYVQKVGKERKNAWIATLMEMEKNMQPKLTVQERLKDLRVVDFKLTLEELAERTGLSRSALGKYESDETAKDISPFAIQTLAKFYGVSTDYLLGLTENKNHPNTELNALHLSDDAISVLTSGNFNHRLLSEMICHKDFQRMMLDAEIYVDRIADMRITDMNAVMEAVRQSVIKKKGNDQEDLYLRTLELAQVQEDEYFGHVVSKDLNGILCDIRDTHRKDATTADEGSVALDVQKQLQEAMDYKGSTEEKKARLFLANLGIDYDAITKEQFVNLIEVLKLSKHMNSPISRRGKGSMTHGKGKRKQK